jgi:hypothetical protein
LVSGKNTEFALIETHLSCRFRSDARHTNALRSRCDRWRPKFRDYAQDVGEEIAGNGDLGHLERDIAGVADDLRADPDQLLAQSLSLKCESDDILYGTAGVRLKNLPF